MARQTFPAYSNLIGIPYEKKHCWDIAKDFYNQVLGVDLKHIYDGDLTDRGLIKSLIYTHKGEFVKVRKPKFGDLVTIRLHGVEVHLAVYVSNGQILHTTKTTGSIIDRLGRWVNLVTGYYTLNPTKENE